MESTGAYWKTIFNVLEEQLSSLDKQIMATLEAAAKE